jgi:hypothetical protein
MKITKQYVHDYFEKLFFNRSLIRTDGSLVKEILNDHLSYIPNKKLYKFRECKDDNFDVLESKSIWMASADTFNDLFDCTINIDLPRNIKKIEQWFRDNYADIIIYLYKLKYGQDIELPDFDKVYLQSVIQEFFSPSGRIIISKIDAYIRTSYTKEEQLLYKEAMKNIESNYNSIYKIVKNAIDTINNSRDQVRSKMLIYSLSEEYDNRSLWENYSDIYKGFCIEYDFTSVTEQEFESYKNLIYLLPISYYTRKPIFDIVPIFDFTIHKSQLQESQEAFNKKMIIEINKQLLMKSKDYEYEREWRISIENSNNNIQPFPFISKIITGKDISEDNYNKLKNISNKLDVKLFKQVVDKNRPDFIYIEDER